MDFLPNFSTWWNEQGATVATILAVLALLKSMWKEFQQLVSVVWRHKAWSILPKSYRKAKTLYRKRRAVSLIQRELEGISVRIAIHQYDNNLGEDPSASKLVHFQKVTTSRQSWLNDYYVASALESLSNRGSVVKARRFSLNSWPPRPEDYYFGLVKSDESACEETLKIETNDKCVAYQSFDRCPRPSRFEPQHTAETVSPRETRFQTSFTLKEMAPPCDLCWEIEHREQDIRILVDNITKYDLADIATVKITGPEGELQKEIVEICNESQCQADANLIKQIVKEAIDIRQQQLTRCTSRTQYEWHKGEREELVANLREFIRGRIG